MGVFPVGNPLPKLSQAPYPPYADSLFPSSDAFATLLYLASPDPLNPTSQAIFDTLSLDSTTPSHQCRCYHDALGMGGGARRRTLGR